MAWILALLATAGTALTLIVSIRSDSTGEHKRLHWSFGVVTVLAIWGQLYERQVDSTEAREKHAALLAANEKLELKLSPHMRFFPSETRTVPQEQGRTKTTFVFRSAYPVVARDVEIRLTIDLEILEARADFPNEIAFGDSEKRDKLVIMPDRRTIVLTKKTLAAEAAIELSVIASGPAKVITSSVRPE